jgi:cell volume regulation protein A
VTADLLLVGAVLVLAGAVLSKVAIRLGVPSPVQFLAIGMLAGSKGLLGIEFGDVISTTAAAAVFSILRSCGVALNKRFASLPRVMNPPLIRLRRTVMGCALTESCSVDRWGRWRDQVP